jgi:hypothetical protein
MKLVLDRSGGVAGLRKPPLAVDTATLAAADRERLLALVEAAHLAALPDVIGGDAPDQLGYTLSVTGDDGHARTIELTLDAAPPALRALVTELRRLAAAR